jgi:hypothetical protein
MTIRIVVSVPETEAKGVVVRRTPAGGQPWPDEVKHEVKPGERQEFHVWQGSAIQVSEPS